MHITVWVFATATFLVLGFVGILAQAIPTAWQAPAVLLKLSHPMLLVGLLSAMAIVIKVVVRKIQGRLP